MATTRPPERPVGSSEATIAVHWKEEEYFHPSRKFIEQANLSGPAVSAKVASKEGPEDLKHFGSVE